MKIGTGSPLSEASEEVISQRGLMSAVDQPSSEAAPASPLACLLAAAAIFLRIFSSAVIFRDELLLSFFFFFFVLLPPASSSESELESAPRA